MRSCAKWASTVLGLAVVAGVLAGCGDAGTGDADKKPAPPPPRATSDAPPGASKDLAQNGDVQPSAIASDGRDAKATTEAKETDLLRVEDIALKVPAGWERRPPASQMRLAEVRPPKGEGGPAAGGLAVTYFPGGGGGVGPNVDRWFGQFTQPDGKATKEVAKVDKKEIGGLKVTLVDVPGTYREPFPRPGQKQTVFPDYRLLGAILETRDSPPFF